MTVVVCPNCGAESGDRVNWGRLVVHETPPRATWDALPIDGLTRSEIKTLLQLVRGRGSYGALEMLTVGDNATLHVVKVRISHMRRKLRHLPFRIVNKEGWGYRLEDAQAG